VKTECECALLVGRLGRAAGRRGSAEELDDGLLTCGAEKAAEGCGIME
jgi:hypothetical protein